MKEQLKKIFESFTDSGIPGYDCLILENGEEILRITHGVSDGEGTPMRGRREVFSIFVVEADNLYGSADSL